MTPFVMPLLLVVALVLAAAAGPHLIRAASPLLMRTPRAAVVILASSLALWVAAFAAVSLVLAWLMTGPRVLSEPLGQVCQRCLAAASPFDTTNMIETSVPRVLLLALPAAVLAALVGIGILRALRHAQRTRAAAAAVASQATRATVRGIDVLLVEDAHPLAFSLPRRRGGIVISTGLLSALDPDETIAVLEHERAHVRQRHHLIIGAIEAIAWPLRWIPLVAAVADAIPHYLEIAADNHARHRAGTPALASALLKLGSPHISADIFRGATAAPVLHAAGPSRVHQLVAPTAIRSALLPIATFLTMLAAFAVVAVGVHGPYMYVLATGCQLPA